MSVSEHQGGRRLQRRQRYFDPMRVTAIYENPATGWREAVPTLAWVWLLLFGGFYLALRGLWRPALFMLVVITITSMIFAPLLVIVMPAFWILAATQAQKVFHEHYMRAGWYEIDPWQQDDEA